MARTLGRRDLVLAAILSGTAGFIDAIGYLHLGGFFVSFMTGNTTRAGVELSAGQWPNGLLSLGLIVSFLLGVVGGTLVGRRAVRGRARTILVLVASAILLAALAGASPVTIVIAAPLLAAAMGAENTIYSRGGEVAVGLTYITGTIVKMGQHLAQALTGGPRRTWMRYLVLWLAISAGAVAGAAAYRGVGLWSLLLAAIAVLGVAVFGGRHLDDAQPIN